MKKLATAKKISALETVKIHLYFSSLLENYSSSWKIPDKLKKKKKSESALLGFFVAKPLTV